MVRPTPFGLEPGKLYQATRECRLAAKAGDPAGMFWLGYSLLYGHYGISKCEDEGVDWLRQAAAKGSALARSELGRHYQRKAMMAPPKPPTAGSTPSPPVSPSRSPAK